MMDMAVRNADEALARKLSETASQYRLLDAIGYEFEMDEAATRVEIYDNSHIQGTNAVGAMVCAGPEGSSNRPIENSICAIVANMQSQMAMILP